MFSLKKWNLEEYKDALREISDPVERMKDRNATYGMTFIEKDLSEISSINNKNSDCQNKLKRHQTKQEQEQQEIE